MQRPGQDYSTIKGIVKASRKRIVIISHHNPDGDAIGASLGLGNLLRKMDHQVDVLVPNRFPAFLSWMKNADKIVVYSDDKEKAIRILQESEIVFALDFNDLSRIREFDEHLNNSKAYKVLIDHHPNPAAFADLSISDTSASSTAELVYSFIKEIECINDIDREIANCIYAGIMTDTGCFSFNSSLPETFRIVGELLNYGVQKDMIYDLVYDNFTYERMRLMGYCLDQKMKFFPQYKTAYISLTQEEMRKYNFRIGDSEGFVNLPLSVKGVRLSALFTEKKDMIKLSLRSKGSFSVNEMASKHFNGGGHLNAAGGESYDSLEKTIKKFVNLLPEYKYELLSE
jgi:phosphoesterase RecJ-like protein